MLNFIRHRKLIILYFIFSSVLEVSHSNKHSSTFSLSTSHDININPCLNYNTDDNDTLCDDTQALMTSTNFESSTDDSTSDPTNSEADNSLLWTILDSIQVVILFIGLIGNLFTVYLISKAKGHMSPVASVLVIHQALMDALVCAFMIPTFLVPAFWTSGNFHADTFLCHIWHSQFLYWWVLLLSVWTLVLMSIDRFLAIRFPLKYNLVRPKHFMRALIGIYIITFLVALPAVFEFSYNKDTKECSGQFYSDSIIFYNFISTYGFIWFASAYGIPVPLLFIFYGIILNTLRKRMRNTSLGESTIITNANTQATKTFGYVTAFFIFSFSFDSWYYLLYTVGAVSYVYHSPIQVISVFMTALNSCVNPFIYAATMAFVRRAIYQMFHCGKETSGENSQSNKSATVSTITKQSTSTVTTVLSA